MHISSYETFMHLYVVSLDGNDMLVRSTETLEANTISYLFIFISFFSFFLSINSIIYIYLHYIYYITKLSNSRVRI